MLKRKAFSVAEAMIALLIASVALGVTAPMISKQVRLNNLTGTQTQILNRRIETVDNKIDGNISQIIGTKNLADYAVYIQSLEDKINAMEAVTNNVNIQNIVNSSAPLKNYDGDIASINSKLTASTSSMNSLKTNMQNIDKDLSALESDVTKLEQNIKNIVPKGTVAFFNLTTCPSGWSPINANWNGRFPRFAGSYTVLSYNGSTKKFNSTGTSQTLSVGATQEDAIRNIDATFGAVTMGGKYNGAVVLRDKYSSYLRSSSSGDDWASNYTFSANNVVPAAVENRPRSIALLGCVKK